MQLASYLWRCNLGVILVSSFLVIGWHFMEPWEQVPGIWTVEILAEGSALLSRSFASLRRRLSSNARSPVPMSIACRSTEPL